MGVLHDREQQSARRCTGEQVSSSRSTVTCRAAGMLHVHYVSGFARNELMLSDWQ